MSLPDSHLGAEVLAWLFGALIFLGAMALGWVAAIHRGAADLAKAIDKAAAAESRLALALESSRLALWDYDVVSGVVSMSETWSALLGAEPAPTTATIESLTALVPEEDRPAVRSAITAAFKGPLPTYRVEHRVRTVTGALIWILSEGRVVERDATGRALRAIGTNRDITERVRDAEALRASEDQFRGAFEHSAIGMAIVGLDGRWRKVNPALCSITGYSAEEMVSMTFTDITHPEDRAISPERLRELIAGLSDTYQIEKRYVHKHGHPVWVQANVSLVRGPAGEPRHLISQIVDVSERRALQDKVEHLALHDPLTDLPNSRLLLDRLEQALVAAQRAKRPIGVMYIDLDGFKPINDTHGHAAGDRVLKEFAERVKKILRAVDSIARVGGDEFVAILAQITGDEDAGKIAERLLAGMTEPFDIDGTGVTVTASIGLALFPQHGLTAQDLLQRADTAMYRAKRAGKNAYRFFCG